ncbi:MAG: ABC transporter substrate-binding protein [Firmicutes bacterium]|nr:ABC transporter substrate-binding protein [Bacillota bacterium]
MPAFANALAARAAASAVAVGLLAACGQSATAPSPSPASPSTAKSATALTPVVIGKALNTLTLTIANIAEAEGYFKDAGLAVKLITFNGSSQANAALIGGSTQFTMANVIPFELARQQGVPIEAVELIDRGLTQQLIVSKRWLSAHPVPPNASVAARIAALRGSTFAQIGPTDLAEFRLMLAQAHLSPNAVQVVQLGSGPEAAAAMAHGRIDEFQQSPPTSLEVVARGDGTLFLNYPKAFPQWSQMTNDIVWTTTSYARSHPDVVARVVTALARANHFVVTHPQQALALEKQWFPSVPTAVLEQSLQLIAFSSDGRQTAAGWQQASAFLHQLGVLKANSPEPKEGVDWTNQFDRYGSSP